jgi:gamma-glutamyltranspeptidase
MSQDPLLAVSSARLHHQLLPNNVAAEEWQTASTNFSTPASILAALRRRGHNVTQTDWGAACQLIVIDSESSSLTSVSDPRKDGAPSGF